jgi:hypothetical protein
MITIYCLIDPRDNSIFYVGRTTNFTKRMFKHNSPQTNKGTFKNEYIKSLKAAGYKFIPEILEVVTTKEEGKFWETFYTQLFRSWGFDLQNNKYWKMGNQTSFLPGMDVTPVVALSKSGNLVGHFSSVKEAKVFVKGKQVGQCLLAKDNPNRSKTSGGYLWLYRDEYEKMPQAELDDFVKWATTPQFKANNGSFKKGHPPTKRVHVPKELSQEIVFTYKSEGLSKKEVAKRFDISVRVFNRLLREAA